MAAKLGKCINYAGCGIAYRNELVPAQTTAFICPECGKPLKDRSASMRMPPWVGAVGALLVLLVLAGGWWLFGSRFLPSKPKSDAVSPVPSLARTTPTPSMMSAQTPASETAAVELTAAATPTASTTPSAARFDPSAEPIISAVPDATPISATKPTSIAPTPTATAPKKPLTYAERIAAAASAASASRGANASPAPIASAPTVGAANNPELPPVTNPDAVTQEREEVRREVLKRIDAMPKLTQANRSKLYDSVEKSKSMNKLFTVSFDLGQSSLRVVDEAEIKRQVKSASFQQLASEPSTVFVILGYADTQGDPQRNLQLSNNRAQSALDELKDRYSVMNVMHAVGMGGSNLLDTSKKAKNRVAEIWAVSP